MDVSLPTTSGCVVFLIVKLEVGPGSDIGEYRLFSGGTSTKPAFGGTIENAASLCPLVQGIAQKEKDAGSSYMHVFDVRVHVES